MGRHISKPELLLPAGDFTSVIAAVQNGADAVYLGQKMFSARQSANNFDREELISAVSYCHIRGVKVYQTLNTLIFDSQLSLLEECLKNACDAGVDALIVQDLGVYSLAKRLCPEMRLHASTQMTVHTVDGARLMKELGFKRVVLARELKKEQIKEICEKVDIETEVFVHGALCMSVSGQCYISGMIGARSGNRGACAGTCRLPFSSTAKESNDLSLKDLCLAPHIEELREIGVTSFKIEGRMKRPEYVAAAAKTYSDVISGEDYDIGTLKAVFSRSGFTNGYFTGTTGKIMFGVRRKEDVVSATAKLLKSLENSYKQENGRVPLSLFFEARKNEPLALRGTDIDGNAAQVTGNIPQAAENKPATAESAEKSLSKLGGTIFTPEKIEAEVEDGLFLPASELNELRRAVCEEIIKQRSEIKPIPFFEEEILLEEEKEENAGFKFRAHFEKFDRVPFGVLSQLEYFSLPIDEITEHKEELLKYKEKLLIEPDRVMFGNEKDIKDKLADLKNAGFNKVLCRNIAHIKAAKELSMIPFGSAFLNCSNSLSLSEYEKLGVDDMTLSFELNLSDLVKIKGKAKRGLMIYGKLPLMIVRNCPMKNQGGCHICDQKGSLTDRKGKRFEVICNRRKYSEVLNSSPLYMADRLSEVYPCDFGVMYFTTEDKAAVEDIITSALNRFPPDFEGHTRGLYYRNI